MRVCGIDIKANEIVVCILSLDRGLFEAPDMRQRRINIANADDPKQLRSFQQTVIKLMEDYKIDKMAIKARMQKGKFAGSASGFKLEAVLQLIDSPRAYLISPAVIKETQKYHPLPVEFRDTGLKAFQEQAFMAAYTQLVGPRHPPKKETTAVETLDEMLETPEFVAAKKPVRNVAEKRPESTEEKSTPKADSPWAGRNKKPHTEEPAHSNETRENPWKKN